MGHCLFAYPDRLLSATLTGGSWESALPLSHLGDRRTSKVARSTDATAGATTFNADLGAVCNLRLFALLGSNLSAAATARLRIYTDSGHTQLVHDTGALPMPWAAIDAETLTGWRPDFWHVLPATYSGRYVRVDFSDAANPAGYVELGRCCLMPAWQPQVNMLWGAAFLYDHSGTTIEKSLGGVRYAARRRPLRSLSVDLAHLGSDEAHQAVAEMQRVLGRDGELFFVYDPDDADFWRRQKSFLAIMEEIDPLEYPYIDNYATAFRLLEQF